MFDVALVSSLARFVERIRRARISVDGLIRRVDDPVSADVTRIDLFERANMYTEANDDA